MKDLKPSGFSLCFCWLHFSYWKSAFSMKFSRKGSWILHLTASVTRERDKETLSVPVLKLLARTNWTALDYNQLCGFGGMDGAEEVPGKEALCHCWTYSILINADFEIYLCLRSMSFQCSFSRSCDQVPWSIIQTI